MAIICPKSVKGLAMRITEADECGVPLGDSANTRYQGLGFISLSLAPDVEAGVEIKTKDAAGNICIHDRDMDRLLGFNAELKLCGLPFPVLELLLGVTAITKTGDTVGAVLPDTEEGNNLAPRTIELWSKNADEDECSGGYRYIQWALPHTDNWVPSGNLMFDENAQEWSLSGYVKKNPNWTASVGGEWSGAAEAAIRNGGPLAWQAVAALPTPLDSCAYYSYSS